MATDKYLNKTGLQRFWDGIKTKIAEKAKITLTGVDPGEGASLAAGEYIAVYGEPDWLDRIYPVGSIYLTVAFSTAAQVAAALGGTWVAWGAGKIPIGVDTSDTDFDTVEETGGTKTHRHDFKIGITSHYGAMVGDNLNNQGAYKYSTGSYPSSGSTGSSISIYKNNGIQNAGGSATATIRESTGDTDLGSNMPPYITCYMYKRTA